MTIQLGDSEWLRLNERRHRLIDIKYTDGLTREQALELQAIRDQMDAADEPFYDAILSRLNKLFGAPS